MISFKPSRSLDGVFRTQLLGQSIPTRHNLDCLSFH
jgi:hypothetical protein